MTDIYIIMFHFQGTGKSGISVFTPRTLAASSLAKLSCLVAAFLILVFGTPPILLGAAAASTGTDNFYILM